MEHQCSASNVFPTIDQTNNLIELEGLAGNFQQIEKFLQDLCSLVTQRSSNDRQNSPQWIYYDRMTNKHLMFEDSIRRQLEQCYLTKQKGLVRDWIRESFH